MRFSKSRYVTVCQQALVAATVSALALTAAGVVTLDIVGPTAQPAESALGHGSRDGARDLAPAVDRNAEYVATRPVTPHVREVAVARSEESAGTGSRPSPVPDPSSAPNARRMAPATPADDSVHGMPVIATTTPQPVAGFATVGVTWAHGVVVPEGAIALQVRTLRNGAWSSWQALAYHDDHGPDGSGSDDEGGRTRPGTDPLVIGRAGRVQLRVATASGTLPQDLELAVVDPGQSHLVTARPAIDTAQIPASDATRTGAPVEQTSASASPTAASSDIALSAMNVATKPQIYSRAQWGANEKLREQTKPDYGTIETGFIHHTVNANDYTRADVPALIRGIYAYHVLSRGWRDIGYNFLVDRFGRIWEGRYGGVDRPVVGAHTKGFNEVSFAMSAIGNFDVARPPQAVLDAYARLFAWKLSLYDIPADASGLRVKGTVLNAINGHRDVGQTACPGRYLYAKIPSIRVAAAALQRAATTPPETPSPTPTPTPTPPPSGYDPLQAARAATPQPGGIAFPSARSLVGDARPDVALQTATGQLWTLPTGGMVGFGTPVVSRGHWNQMSRIVASGDLTGDGLPDVLVKVKRAYRGKHGAVARLDTGWRIYPGTRGGHVSSHRLDNAPRFHAYRQLIAAGDWNRDGHADVLGISTADGGLYLARGTARPGRFRHRVLLARSWPYAQTVVAGDLTGDGRSDVVGLGSDHRLHVASQTSSGGLAAPHGARRLGSTATGLAGGGDLTGDGIGDVTVLDRATRSVQLVTGNGRGGFGPTYGPFPRGGISHVSVAAFAGGARPDLVGRVGSSLVVRPDNEATNVGPVVDGHRKAWVAKALLSAGDWNRDGIGDVITHQDTGDRLTLHRGVGGGRFARGQKMSNGWTAFTRIAAVGDVTGDGLPDLMASTAHGPLRIYPGDGDHGFEQPVAAPPTLRTFNTVGGSSWRPADATDLIVSADGSFVPYAGTGTAAAAVAGAGAPMSAYDWFVGAGDVNGDGRPDLLARQRSNGTLWLMPGTANGLAPRQFVAGGLGKYRLGG